MQVDQAPEGGKFRAVAATALGGTAGAWGDADMLCVTVDGNGELIVSSAGDGDGVIWTKESTRPLADGSENEVVAGKKYTVFTYAELVEAEIGASPALAAGDRVYATDLGDVTLSPATGDIFIGVVMESGSRVVVNVNGQPASA